MESEQESVAKRNFFNKGPNAIAKPAIKKCKITFYNATIPKPLSEGGYEINNKGKKEGKRKYEMYI